MNKKLLLLGIGIVAVLAVACRAKNAENEAIHTDNKSSETKSETTTDTQSTDDNLTQKDNTETSNTETPNTETPNTETPNTDENIDSHNSEESGASDQKRNLNYKDVDIKVPSIHED